MQTREEKNEYNRLYRQRNKEKIKANNRKYYSKNKENIKQKANNYYSRNKEKCNEQAKRYREENLEKVKEVQQEWYRNNPEKVKEQKLRKTYGISLEQYNGMYEKQNGRCAICGTHQNELKQMMSVDHCHETNRIRGLLCNKCNRGIGYLRDDVKIVENALKYLSFG